MTLALPPIAWSADDVTLTVIIVFFALAGIVAAAAYRWLP
jgi:hypothetical protein